MKLIDLYKKWMEDGEIDDRRGAVGNGGLCNALPKEYLDTLHILVSPESYSSWQYWGYECSYHSLPDADMLYKFTPLRQNIVLFICAIHNEI